MSMRGAFSSQEGYSFSQQSAADEPYFHAGAHHLPQTLNDIPSTQQIEQDIDDGLELFPAGTTIDFDSSNATTSQTSLDDSTIDLSSLELPLEFPQPWMTEIANSAYEHSQTNGTSLPADNNQEAFVPQPPRRTNSDLRATAPAFVPANQQWQNQQMLQWTSQNLQDVQSSPSPSFNTNQPNANNNNLQSQRSRNWISHMTPLRTNLPTIYQTPPMSAPSRPDPHASQHLASPMISLTNDFSITTSIPQHAGNGYQWGFTTPPALDINTWAQGMVDFVDPAHLTPITPVTPVYGGSSLERTTSRTSRTSRTTNGPYVCTHDNCDKEFKTKTEFSHHKRNHGERHHVCGICGKKFVFRKDLGRHEKTHTGARQMFGDVVDGCQWCAKGFQRKDHYERHMITHQKRGDVLTPAASSDAMSRSQSRQ